MNMKVAQLIHNPDAGDDDHTKQDLIKLIEANGYECRYSSTKKKGWEKIEDDTDFIICAGGDGTVRKIVDELLDRKILSKIWPIALLPMGSANNIAKTLEISGEAKDIIEAWKNETIKMIDVGLVSILLEARFLLES